MPPRKHCKTADCCDDAPLVLLTEHEKFCDELAPLTRALAHPMRIMIVRLLLKRKSCVCGEIVNELPLAQSTVSQHLKILRESGLVEGEISGPKVCYCVDPKKLKLLKTLIAGL